MTIKGDTLQAVLEDLGLHVRTDGARGRFVDSAAAQIAFYDLHEDGAFRFGWVQFPNGTGRCDCTSWVEFHDQIRNHIS